MMSHDGGLWCRHDVTVRQRLETLRQQRAPRAAAVEERICAGLLSGQSRATLPGTPGTAG